MNLAGNSLDITIGLCLIFEKIAMNTHYSESWEKIFLICMTLTGVIGAVESVAAEKASTQTTTTLDGLQTRNTTIKKPDSMNTQVTNNKSVAKTAGVRINQPTQLLSGEVKNTKPHNKSTYSTPDSSRSYSSVRQQQGSVNLDEDWNDKSTYSSPDSSSLPGPVRFQPGSGNFSKDIGGKGVSGKDIGRDKSSVGYGRTGGGLKGQVQDIIDRKTGMKRPPEGSDYNCGSGGKGGSSPAAQPGLGSDCGNN